MGEKTGLLQGNKLIYWVETKFLALFYLCDVLKKNCTIIPFDRAKFGFTISLSVF